MNKGEFIEIEYEGKANGETFDKGDSVIPIGKGEVIKGMDEELLKHKVGDEFEFDIPPEKGYGKRNPSLIQIIPLGELLKHNVNPRPGLVLNINGVLGKVLSVSGGRVTIDFNHPLAGKVLHYKVKIKKEIKDEKEKIKGTIKTLTDKDVNVEEKDGKFYVKGEIENKDLMKEKIKELLGVEIQWMKN